MKKYKIWDNVNKKYLDPGKYGITQYGDIICYSNQLVLLDGSDFNVLFSPGLTDKNGKEIYEGDIDKHEGIVTWNDVELCWSVIDLNWNDRREWHNLDYTTSPLEVIGNIHEDKNKNT